MRLMWCVGWWCRDGVVWLRYQALPQVAYEDRPRSILTSQIKGVSQPVVLVTLMEKVVSDTNTAVKDNAEQNGNGRVRVHTENKQPYCEGSEYRITPKQKLGSSLCVRSEGFKGPCPQFTIKITRVESETSCHWVDTSQISNIEFLQKSISFVNV